MNPIAFIRQQWFAYQTRRQTPRTVHFPVYDRCKTILLLYESDILEKNPFIKEIIRRLNHEGKEVTAWGFMPYKPPTSPILPQSRMLGWRDTCFTHNLKDTVRQDLQKETYDLLIDLTQNSCLPLHYTAMHAHANFKIGRQIVEGIHDMMINMPAAENPTPLFNQMIHFLTTIRSND